MSDNVGRCGVLALLGAVLIASLSQACSPKTTKDEGTSSENALESAGSGGGLVISQVYGGAGMRGATWNRGFVELFNRTKAPIPLKGLAIHYAGPISEFGLAATLPDAAVVPAGGYFLVGFLGGQDGLDVRPDSTGMQVGILPVNGKLALVKAVIEDSHDAQAQKMGCGSVDAGTCVGNARVLDVVGYGVTTDHEGPSTAKSPSMATSLMRKGGGCIDTGDNLADFEVIPPQPRTAQSATHVCAQ